MRPKAIELHIGELVLDGITADGRGVAEAARRELARLLAERGLPSVFSGGGDHVSLRGTALQLGTQPSANAIGAAVAASVIGAKR